MKKFLMAAFICFLLTGSLLPLKGELPPLIPRNILFGNPEKTSPQLSSDGKFMAYLAPDKNAY